MSSFKWYVILLSTCFNYGDKMNYFEKCIKTVSTFVHPCTGLSVKGTELVKRFIEMRNLVLSLGFFPLFITNCDISRTWDRFNTLNCIEFMYLCCQYYKISDLVASYVRFLRESHFVYTGCYLKSTISNKVLISVVECTHNPTLQQTEPCATSPWQYFYCSMAKKVLYVGLRKRKKSIGDQGLTLLKLIQ